MMQPENKISVIVPCYNVAKYVERCVSSILTQTYQHLEVICINDGSTDDTLELLHKLELTDARLTVIDQKNKGLSETRNVGIERANGRYMMFVDGDDWLEKDCVKKMFLPDYDMICCSYSRIFRNHIEPRILGIDGEIPSQLVMRRILGLTGNELRDPEQANTLVTAWGKIYKSELIWKYNIRFISTRIVGTEDALFNLEYLSYCSGQSKIIDQPFYNYLRYNELSLTSTYKPELISQWNTLHSMMWDMVKGKEDLLENAYYNRIALSIIGLGLNEVANPAGWSRQLKNIRTILDQPVYRIAYRKLDLSQIPMKWEVLFLLAKSRSAVGVWSLMKVISAILKQKNK